MFHVKMFSNKLFSFVFFISESFTNEYFAAFELKRFTVIEVNNMFDLKSDEYGESW